MLESSSPTSMSEKAGWGHSDWMFIRWSRVVLINAPSPNNRYDRLKTTTNTLYSMFTRFYISTLTHPCFRVVAFNRWCSERGPNKVPSEHNISTRVYYTPLNNSALKRGICFLKKKKLSRTRMYSTLIFIYLFIKNKQKLIKKKVPN